jgi:hypothetical protein
VSASALRSALAAMHIAGDVESDGKVAVLVTPSPEQLADPRVRTAAIEAATAHGFRTLAVELAGTTEGTESRFPMPEVAHLHRA